MIENKSALKLIVRFIIFALITSSIIASVILINIFGPTENLYSDDSWSDLTSITPPGYELAKHNVILDHHSHTLHSDGRLTVRQNVEWHIAMGFNTIIITDHNTVSHVADIKAITDEYLARDVIIIPGMEWTTNRVHLNFVGLSDWDLPIPNNPTDEQIREAIAEAHRQGAVVVLNHIPWSIHQAKMKNHPTRQQALEWGIDFIEIVNDDSQPPYAYDQESDEFCDVHFGRMGKITGTDMHLPDGLANGGVSAWTLIDAPVFTEEAIMDELRARRTEIIRVPIPFKDQGLYEKNSAYYPLKPLIDIGQIFINLWNEGFNPVHVSFYIFYGLLIFIILELYRFYKLK